MAIGLESNLASCCMCFSIKTGCKIIGMLSLFFSAMHFMMYTMMLIQLESNLPRCYEMLHNEETDHPALRNNCFQQSIWFVRGALLFGCLLYLFGLIGSAMLLKGISKKLPKLFYAWFLFCTVIIVRNLMSYGTFHNLNDGMKNLLFSLVLLYFFCIVKYHERELIVGIGDSYGPNQIGNTALQEVVPSYPTHVVPPKDSPPPYSVVVSSAPPPYSACVGYYPESQLTNVSSPITVSEQGDEATRVGDVTAAEQIVVGRMQNVAVTNQTAFAQPVENNTPTDQRTITTISESDTATNHTPPPMYQSTPAHQEPSVPQEQSLSDMSNINREDAARRENVS